MKINKIELINFRSHSKTLIKPKEGINLIVGPNGSGKTNLIEAIYYCCFARSFKNADDKDLLTEGKNSYVIRLNIEKKDKTYVLSCVYQNNKRCFMYNSKPVKKLSEINSMLNVLLFQPKLVNLFSDAPAERRKYFDLCISKNDSLYLDHLKRYRILLKERNLALKNDKVDKIFIFTLTNQIIGISEYIDSKRKLYIDSLNEKLETISNSVSNNQKALNLIYEPIVPLNHDYGVNLLRLYQNCYEDDVFAKQTQVGIHKEDYQMHIDKKPIQDFGSQGENRISVLSLILAQYELAKEKPVLLLDDVLSELDEENKQKFINELKKIEQTFITSTNEVDECFKINLQGE